MGIKLKKEYNYIPSKKNIKVFTRNSNLAFYIAIAWEHTVKILSKNEMDAFKG
jgi:hypothetical protein